jgi:hypothetical protein
MQFVNKWGTLRGRQRPRRFFCKLSNHRRSTGESDCAVTGRAIGKAITRDGSARVSRYRSARRWILLCYNFRIRIIWETRSS